jgi:GNAT superfamily N-acetyltransferase
MGPVRIRLATDDDIPAIARLIDLSVRSLQAEDYSPTQIEGALETVFGVDGQLIADGTYFIAESAVSPGDKEIAGCGGWSKRRTLFGSDKRSDRENDFLDPAREKAKIRAFFVHPSWARRGVGSLILEACEKAAVNAGFRGFEMGATLTGARLYTARGYAPVERIEVPLGNGASLPIIRMSKVHAGL